MRISDWSSDVCSSDLRIDIGRVLPVVGRALLDLRFLGAGDADDIVADDEIAQFGNLIARGGDRAFGRHARLILRRARDDRRAGGELRERLLQHGLVLVMFGLADTSYKRRAGQECLSQCRSSGSKYHKKKK